MKTKSWILTLVALLAFAGNVMAQTDVTATYLTNADFSSGTPINNGVCTYGKDMATNGTTYYGAQPIEGWTNASVGTTDSGYENSKLAGALYQYGSGKWLAGTGTKVPATAPNGEAGHAAGLCAVWGGSIQYTQALTLPAGNYTIIFDVYNASDNHGSGKLISTNLFGFKADAGTTYYAPNNTFAIEQWTTISVSFSLAAETAGSVSMGFVGPGGNADMPHLFVDNVKILSNPYLVDKTSSVGTSTTAWTTPYSGKNLENPTYSDISMAAVYNASTPAGTALTQTVSGLDNGIYQVELYALSQRDWEADGSLTHDAGNISYVFANDLRSWMNARDDRTNKAHTVGVYTIEGVLVSDGNLTLGLGVQTAGNVAWHAIQIKSLKRVAGISGAITLLANKLNSYNGKIPATAYNNLSSAVNTYNKEYDNVTDLTAAMTAVQELYDAADLLKSPYAAYYAYKTQAESLMAGVDDGDTKTTFTNAISTATANVEVATTANAINTEKDNLRSGAITFISGTSGQFNITFLASQTYSDWKKKNGSAAGEVTWAITDKPEEIPSFAESYEETCATTGTVLYQTVSQLPAGYYQVGMYAQAMYTSGRGFDTEANEGDANRSFAFAGDQRTGLPIAFGTSVAFTNLTTLDVNVHLSTAGDLTFGVTKDANGSNWHFAQIASIVYSNTPDITALKATRDALVAEAEGILSGSADYLTTAQQTALQSAIDAGNAADDFDELNAVTLTTLPNAINTANQQVQQVTQNRVLMIAALERFENDYNLTDGTDYRRVTMSADAWATLINKVNAVSTALDDVSQAANYATIKNELVSQLNATDTSLRLFKSYKAMVDGTTALGIAEGTTYAADSYMDSDTKENEAITALNTAFQTYATGQNEGFSVSAFLGDNLDFSAAQGSALSTDNDNAIYHITGWTVDYTDADQWSVIQNQHSNYPGQLYLRKNWGSSATSLSVTKQKMLPVGKYRLSLSWNSDMANMTNRSAYVIGNASTAIGEETNEAKMLTYDFQITETAKPFDLILGFVKTNTGNTPAQLFVDNVTLTYYRPDISLANAADNTATISGNDGILADVTLTDRTLWKDGSWNTLCLPFNMTAAQVTAQLAPNALMELDTESTINGHQTGTEGNTVYLNFKDVTTIEAGKPYLIKWDTADDLANPVFSAVTIADGSAAGIKSSDGTVTFQGTYAPASLTKDDENNLFMGADNKLYWPTEEGYKVNAFRAYFQLNDGVSARQFVLNFGEEEPTGVERIEPSLEKAESRELKAESYYNLNSQKVETPTKGLYIKHGKKVLFR